MEKHCVVCGNINETRSKMFCSTKCQQHYYYLKNKEQRAKYKKKYYKNNKESYAKSVAKWQNNNCDKVKQYHTEYYIKNRDKRIEYQKKYQKEHYKSKKERIENE